MARRDETREAQKATVPDLYSLWALDDSRLPYVPLQVPAGLTASNGQTRALLRA